MNTVAELALSEELVEVLTQIELANEVLKPLLARRMEILTSLNDGIGNDKKPGKAKKTEQTPQHGPRSPEAFSDAISGKGEFTPKPEDEMVNLDDPMALYEAGIPKRSQASMNRIFAILAEKGFKEEKDMKAILNGIIMKQHGVAMGSTKDLSQPWANDINNYLTDVDSTELAKMLEIPF